MKRAFQLPQSITSATNFEDVTKNRIWIAYSDSGEKHPLTFEPCVLHEDNRVWCDFQFDIETNKGSAAPRDMIFGFVLLDGTPRWKEQPQTAFKRMLQIKYGCEGVPALQAMKRLTKQTYLSDGLWLVFVRWPRPVGAKWSIPYNRRRDVLRLRIDSEIYNKPAASQALEEIKRKIDSEPPHPTEAQMYFTAGGCVVSGVGPHIVCTTCGAVGHHMAHTHEWVYDAPNKHMSSCAPHWMNVLPLPKETLQVPKLADESKGFELRVRQTSAHVPLRLARAMKLRGLHVEGDVYMTGASETQT